uniref:RNA helicase n=1 Tax=Monopterus albus TaxID=43700 RepID=A0A3Q3J0H7_MONAL
MLKLSVLKVENPSCFWGRVIWASGGNTQTTEQYDNLHTQMNLFYHNISWNLRKLNPRPIEEGKVYVVYWPVMKSWCRAMVESVIMDSESCRARCLLVDHGEWLVAPSDQIRDAAQNFLQLPVWVRKFHLGGIQPTTLRVSFLEKAKLVPSTRWDSSATLYLHNLLKDSTQAEAVLLESEPESTSIELYLTIRDIKICVNDDLVAKGFAYYSSTKSTDGSGLGEVVRFPVVPSSGLHQIVSKTSNKPPSVRVNSLAAPRAGDLLTAPSPPQSQEHEQMISKAYGRSEVTEQPPGSQSKNSLGAAAERASSEDPDLSPSAALTTDLSLFRSLKSLNSSTVYQQEAHSELNDCHPTEMTSVCITCTKQDELTSETVIPEEDVLLCMSGKSGAASFVESRQVHLPDAGDETSSESGPTEKTWRCIEDWACARLLEWLNPGRLNPNPHAADDVVVPSDPRRRGILLHTAFPVDPCTNLDDAPITDDLRRVLQRKQYSTLSLADRYSWPAVARGSNTLIVSHSADQPLSYLAPLVTHILYNSIFCSNTYNTGPIAVLLCPGWEKAQMLYDLLEEIKVTHVLHPVIVLLGVGKDEAKSVKIPKNCLLLVTTPFSLVLLLSCRCFMFMRLYHVVLDEADQLLTHAADQMVTILQHFQKVTFSEINASCPKQLIAVAKRWAGGMEGLVGTYMPSPFILITIPEEVSLLTLESSKISVMLGALEFNPDISQKTLIVASSAQEVEDVFKVMKSKSTFCLRTHEGLTHQFDNVIQQWRKDIGPRSHVVLVTTTGCLECLGITDASCVIHYSFPTSRKLFGNRLLCMADNFRNLADRDQTESHRSLARSVLLISERNISHIVGVVRYMGRTNTLLPPVLLSFTQGILVTREYEKTNRPLCSYLKSFGVCRDSSMCPDRHRLISQLDQSELPASGVIQVVPLYVKTASLLYGHIIGKDDGGFHIMTSEMASYYADRKPGAKEMLVGGLYAVEEDDVFHRVKILPVPDRHDGLFFRVQFIDVGKEQVLKSCQILELPEQFHSLPSQAVEMIICHVKPVNAEKNWHPKVTRTIGQKIRGLVHQATAVLSLGNTVFVDPMVRVRQVPGLKTVINEYNIQSEILKTGMAVPNPDHVALLRALWQEEPSSGTEAVHIFG